VTHRLSVLVRALASGRLRRVEATLAGFGIGEYGVCVVVLVFAFRCGGRLRRESSRLIAE
jgi:hypothetical protein